MVKTGEPSDSQLYGRFLRGETQAYDQLMIRYGDSLVLYLNGYLHDWHEAEDLMIEAFARIMVKKPRISDGAFRAYLFRTGRNLALRFHERKRRMQSFSLDGMEQEAQDSIFAVAENLSSQENAGSIPQNLIDEERNQSLYLCLERIEPELKEALWLVYGEKLSYAEAALVMGVKVKRIDRLLARAKQSMRKELEREGITNAY